MTDLYLTCGDPLGRFATREKISPRRKVPIANDLADATAPFHAIEPIVEANASASHTPLSAKTPPTVDNLSPDVGQALLAAIQTDAPDEYAILGKEDGYYASNPAQHLDISFTPSDVRITDLASGLKWGMALTNYGRGEKLQPVAEAELVAIHNRLEYRRGELTEWYLNGTLGLEQGFTLQQPPVSNNPEDSLIFELSFFGDLIPVIAEDAQSLSLATHQGETCLNYGQLYANDATGRTLPIRLEFSASDAMLWTQVRLVVDDHEAVYPITVDPLIQQELTASDGAAGDNFGYSVALSSDGNIALIGAYLKKIGTNPNQGAAYVFMRSGGVWTQQQEITVSSDAVNTRFGCSVALSSDGRTALIGAEGTTVGGNTYQGAAYVFVRSGGIWTQQWELIGDSSFDGGVYGGNFGNSVALSSDGNTALVGAYLKAVGAYANFQQGAAYVFVRSGGSWSLQWELTGSDSGSGDHFGASVALSSDGNTALVGAKDKKFGTNNNQGAAYVFVRSGGVWRQQWEFSDSSGRANDNFGYSVALSSDGNTALVGDIIKRAAYVFVRSGATWTSLPQILTGGGGAFVALSSDGNTALTGTYVFVHSNGAWTQQQIITGGGPVALASDGNTALVGAYSITIGTNRQQGAAYIIQIGPNEPSNTGKVYWPLTWTGKPFLGNSIDVLHGEKSEEVTDLILNTPAGPMTFTRTYRQQPLVDLNSNFMGLGWTHNHSPSLTTIAGTPNALVVQLPNAGELHLAESSPGSGNYGGDPAYPGSTATATLSGGQYVLTAMDKSTYVFVQDTGTRYRLLTHAWPNGEQWNYTYDAASGSHGKLLKVDDNYTDGAGNALRSLQFTYDGNNRLQTVSDPSGRTVQFSYGTSSLGNPLLSVVVDVRGYTWTYGYTTYGSEDYLTTRQSPPVDLTGAGGAGTPIVLESLNYTLSGTTVNQLVDTRGNGLLQTTFAFQPSGSNITTETTASKITTHFFNNGVYAGVQDPAGNYSSQSVNFQYRPTLQIDADQNQTRLNWSSDGSQLLQINDALNNQTQFLYNSTPTALSGTLSYSLDPQGRKTLYIYDLSSTLRLPAEIQVLDTDGTVLRRQQFTYDSKGRTTIEQTLNPVTGTPFQKVTRVYYTAGSATGLLQSLTQNDLLNPANNITTTYFYDRVGRVIRTNQSATFGSCLASFTLYDPAGNVVASICSYDPGTGPDPVTVAQALALYNPNKPDINRVTTYTYDSLGRRVLTTTDAGATFAQTTLTAYDALSRVVRTIANYVPIARIPDPYVHVHSDFN